jgi:hypothetical protein
VVDAINSNKTMEINFPKCHERQKQIAAGFQHKSTPGFGACVGAIDGMLVWTEKPHESECVEMECGSGRFMCGRKGKFGLNLQAVCDHCCCFTEVWIGNPGSSSDYISFIRSELFQKLQQKSFLAEGLALFGDNAYV